MFEAVVLYESLNRGDKMAKRLGFGCMRLPLLDKDEQTSFDTETLNKLVDTFLEKGFTYFDTAYTYRVFLLLSYNKIVFRWFSGYNLFINIYKIIIDTRVSAFQWAVIFNIKCRESIVLVLIINNSR